jgi:hypothetical protein
LSYFSMTAFCSQHIKPFNLSFMNTLEGLPMWELYKDLSTKADKQSAWRVIKEFFRLFDEKEPQELLWFMLTTALRADNEEIEARHRGNMIFFYEYSVVFFKAVRVLSEQHAPKPALPKKKRKTTVKRSSSTE